MRALASGAITALAASQVAAVLLIDMGFSPAIYVASSAVPIVWGGNTYLGAGPLGAVETVRDSAGDAQALQFSLSGVPTENLALALGQSARNKTCTVRLAVLNADTHAIEDVSTLGVFMLDQLTINGSTIAVSAFPMSRVFARLKTVRYTDGDQQRISAGDKALEYLNSQSTTQDVWPASSWGRR
jgi:hypothetical protein